MFKSHSILLTTLVLFLIFLPQSLSIDFMQNDDWNRYYTVSQFLLGRFNLLEVTATTFYTQGFLGMAFAKIFSIEKLPILTLAFGCLNFYIFARICNEFFKQNKLRSILVALVFFFNPIHFYSIFGFMTEVYLLFFVLLSVYFYYAFLRNSEKYQFVLANLFWVCGFFAKQWAIVFPAAISAYLFLNKRYKWLAAQVLILMLIVGYYFLLFPETYEMSDTKTFDFGNFMKLEYVYVQIYAYLIYLIVFALPFVFSFLFSQLVSVKSKVTIATIVIFSLVLAFFGKFLFEKIDYAWHNFPLYPNVFTDRGFFLILTEGIVPKNLYTDLIRSYDEIGLLCLSLLFLVLFATKKIKLSLLGFELNSILIGLLLIIGTPVVFDRYLIVFVPIMILMFLKWNNYKINLWVLCVYLLIQSLISIDFGLEYMSRQKQIWTMATAIRKNENIPENRIMAGHAWGKYYQIDAKNIIYKFKYADGVNPETEEVTGKINSKGIFTGIDIVIVKAK